MSSTKIKNSKITLWISLLILGLFFAFVPNVQAEVIRDYSSTINVLPDSSIFVKEIITYDFEDVIRHGIDRNINLTNSKDKILKIEDISVFDDQNNAYKFTTHETGSLMTIKIGDANKMISGLKEFIISYRVWGAINYYKDFDEIGWNVVGTNWSVNILKSEVKVVLPNNVFAIKQSCYYGKLGNYKNCEINESGNLFLGKMLDEKDDLVVSAIFPKGVVSVYKPQIIQDSSNLVETFWPIVIPIFVFIYMAILWYKKGRDRKGSGVIVPQYDVFENLTPLEVADIINGRISNQDISAEIIYLATKGFIKIKQIDETCDNFLCLISKKDYQFTLLKERGLLTNTFDKIIIKAIFDETGKIGGTSKLSELNNKFYKSLPEINNNVAYTLLGKEYYLNLPRVKNKYNYIFGVLVFGILLFVGNFFNVADSFDGIKKLLILIFSLVLSIIIYFTFNSIMSAKSHKGARALEYFLGLKEYLQIAEKDRLNFHNDPSKKPETFEVLLPYAIVFGVEELWAKEFKDIYTVQPKWYEKNQASFDVVSFGHEMAIFNDLASISFSSSSGGTK